MRPAVLIQAHIARAGMLVIATPETFDVRQMMQTARSLNPGIETVVRTHTMRTSLDRCYPAAADDCGQ